MARACLGFHDQNGEIAAVRALFEEVPLAGRVVTLDALHTVRDTARTLVDTHRADYLLTVEANARKAFAALRQIDWEQPGTRCCAEEPSQCLPRKGHAVLNNALCSCIAIAVILSSGQDIADGQRYFSQHRKEAFQAVLTARQALRPPD